MSTDPEREKAIRKVLYALKNPLVLMSIPDREEAVALSDRYGITVVELLEYAYKRSRNV